MTIHKEGRVLLVVLLLVFVALNAAVFQFLSDLPWLGYGVLALTVVFYLLILQFFRSPRVQTPADERLVYAPADGKVVVIEETTEEEFLKEPRIQVSIFMSPVNVHVNRSPIAGIVTYAKYHAGKYLVAWHPKSSTENERTTVVVKNKAGVQVLFRQIAGALARRIKCYVEEGDQLAQGGEFGFIKFGSRVDIYLPLGTEINVAIDQKTKGGRTVNAALQSA